jgi:hypothetical protein
MVTRTALATIFMVGLGIPAAFAQTPTHPRQPPAVNARQHHQAERIKDGVTNGSITRAEADRLRADEAAIRAEERVYRRSGDGLTPQERKDLERDLNQTSREIVRAKHNGKSR